MPGIPSTVNPGPPVVVRGDVGPVDPGPPPGLRFGVGAVHHQAVQPLSRDLRTQERAELAALGVGHDRPAAGAVPRLDDGRAEHLQIRQIAGVDVQVHPVLDGFGCWDPVDPDRVLPRGPPQQALTVILRRPGAGEHGRPERAEPGWAAASRHKSLNRAIAMAKTYADPRFRLEGAACGTISASRRTAGRPLGVEPAAEHQAGQTTRQRSSDRPGTGRPAPLSHSQTSIGGQRANSTPRRGHSAPRRTDDPSVAARIAASQQRPHLAELSASHIRIIMRYSAYSFAGRLIRLLAAAPQNSSAMRPAEQGV
jgi:hypothetical protein